jgi:hypothetical protein
MATQAAAPYHHAEGSGAGADTSERWLDTPRTGTNANTQRYTGRGTMKKVEARRVKKIRGSTVVSIVKLIRADRYLCLLKMHLAWEWGCE